MKISLTTMSILNIRHTERYLYITVIAADKSLQKYTNIECQIPMSNIYSNRNQFEAGLYFFNLVKTYRLFPYKIDGRILGVGERNNILYLFVDKMELLKDKKFNVFEIEHKTIKYKEYLTLISDTQI